MNTRARISATLTAFVLLSSCTAEARQLYYLPAACNHLGLALYKHHEADNGNLCFSPYSLQVAFAMTANGATGETLKEIQTVLRQVPNPGNNYNYGLSLKEYAKRTANSRERFKGKAPQGVGVYQDFMLTVVNRLFGQSDYPFAPPFLDALEKSYRAPLMRSDFKNDPEQGRAEINKWVARETSNRIANLLPEKSLTKLTRLVLVNALHFRASWKYKFTSPQPAAFRLASDKSIDVPTISLTNRLGYKKEPKFTAVTIPYAENFQMLIIVPDDDDGLSDIVRGLHEVKLDELARLPLRPVSVHLPKFKIAGATIGLKKTLHKLGMKRAFDPKRAEFGAMRTDQSLPALSIEEVYHQTFVSVDEKGTEAAAATAIVLQADPGGQPDLEKPIAVHVNRPFFYAIIDQQSAGAIFMGRIVDPRN